MRSNLENIEQIDLYLQGKLTGDNLAQFEAEMATNSSLKQLVADQQLLIQTVNRKALLAEISAVAGIGLTPWYLKPWFGLSVIAVSVIAVTSYFVATSNGDDSSENKITAIEESAISEEETSSENIELITVTDTNAFYEIVDYPSEEVNQKHNNTTNQNKTGNNNQVNYIITHDSNSENSNEDNLVSEKDTIYTDYADSQTTNRRGSSQASYKNGDMAMRDFIAKNIKYPGTAREKELSGNVKVTFFVDTYGKISEIDANCFAMRDKNGKPLNNTQFVFNQKVAGLFERECARIMRIMPAWNPATDSNGNFVLTHNELYFNFDLNDGIKIYQLQYLNGELQKQHDDFHEYEISLIKSFTSESSK